MLLLLRIISHADAAAAAPYALLFTAYFTRDAAIRLIR